MIEMTSTEAAQAAQINASIADAIDKARAGYPLDGLDGIYGEIDLLRHHIEIRLDTPPSDDAWYDELYDRDSADGWEAKVFPGLDAMEDAQWDATH